MNKQKLSSLFLGLLFVFALSACDKEDEVPMGSVVAKFSVSSNNNFVVPSEITFTNESVVPAEAGTPTYAWDFGDNSTSTEMSPKHTYTTSGTFTVKLVVTTPKTTPVEFTQDVVLKSGDIFSEDFESFGDGVALGSPWVVIDGDLGTPDDAAYTAAWMVFQSSKFNSKVAMATSYYTDETVNTDDWMISPKIAIQDRTYLAWEAMSLTSSGKYKDDYEVYVSTTTQDKAGCVAGKLVKAVVQEEAATTATTPGKGVQKYEIDLSEFKGKEVYIGFRLNTPGPGGSELGIDNVKVFMK